MLTFADDLPPWNSKPGVARKRLNAHVIVFDKSANALRNKERSDGIVMMDPEESRAAADEVCGILHTIYRLQHRRFEAEAKKRGTTVEALAAAIVDILGSQFSGPGSTES